MGFNWLQFYRCALDLGHLSASAVTIRRNVHAQMALTGMGQVIALADFRQQRLKAKLVSFAERQNPAVVETRTAIISAMRIFCRERFALLVDKFGYQTSVNYDSIVDVSRILPVADIISQAGYQIVEENPKDSMHVVLSFQRPSIR